MKTALVLGNSKGIGLAISERLRKEGYEVPNISRTFGYDLMTKEGINKLFSDIKNIDILIGNVGGMGTCAWYDFEEVMKKNYFINAEVALHYISILKENKGIIIFIGSVASKEKHFNPVFAAAKAAEEVFLRNLSFKYPEIRMITVSPGHIEVGKTFPDSPKIIGKTEDIANLVSFLWSDKSNHITGTTIVVDGGESAC